jgi:hypothetical protein
MHAEVLFLCLAAGVALMVKPETSFARLYLVIVLTATAMGLRNAVIRKLAVPDLTTTVLTLTVTGLAADSVLAGGTAPRSGRRMLSILAMGSGALVGTMLVRPLGTWVPLAVAALVVAGLALYLCLRERSTKHEDCAQAPLQGRGSVSEGGEAASAPDSLEFLDAVSNSGLAVRRCSEGRQTVCLRALPKTRRLK